MYDLNDSTEIDLGYFNENAPFAEAFDINVRLESDVASGYQVVGTSIKQTSPTTLRHAFIYENGEIKDLNDLIDCKFDSNGNRDWVLYEARSINDSGIIVGNGLLNGIQTAFMLKPKADTPSACIVEPEDDSGSGSLPIAFLAILTLGGYIRKKQNK